MFQRGRFAIFYKKQGVKRVDYDLHILNLKGGDAHVDSCVFYGCKKSPQYSEASNYLSCEAKGEIKTRNYDSMEEEIMNSSKAQQCCSIENKHLTEALRICDYCSISYKDHRKCYKRMPKKSGSQSKKCIL